MASLLLNSFASPKDMVMVQYPANLEVSRFWGLFNSRKEQSKEDLSGEDLFFVTKGFVFRGL